MPTTSSQLFQIGIGPTAAPVSGWLVEAAQVELPAAVRARLQGQYAGQPLWVREVGGEAPSDPVQLMIL